MEENKKDEKSVHSVLAKASTVHARLIVHAYVKASFSLKTQLKTINCKSSSHEIVNPARKYI